MPTRERLTEKLVRDAIPAEGRDYRKRRPRAIDFSVAFG